MKRTGSSCRFCWTRAFTAFSLAAIFIVTGLIHLADPQSLSTYGFGSSSSYLLGAVEIGAAIALLLGFDIVKWGMLGIALFGAGFHVRFQEFPLLVLPAIPLVLLALNAWANRPQAACACALRHHGPASEPAGPTGAGSEA